MRLLVIEDDTRIASNLKNILASQSYAVDLAASGFTGLEKARDESYDLIVLDWMLPDISGPDVIKILHEENIASPILMLTAKSQPEDLVEGLDAGADDYLSKPFRTTELFARIRALLRRPDSAPTEPVLYVSDLSIDTNLHHVTRAGRPIRLSPREYALLEYLARNQGHALTRLDLLSHVWDENTDPFSNTVDVHIRFLRSKIDDPFPTKLIRTVKGKGYVLADPHAP